jgi:hypothetical protein
MSFEEKDKILSWLNKHVEVNSFVSIPSGTIEQEGWIYKEFTTCLEQFERLNLVSDVGVNSNIIFLIVLPELKDYLLAGGFTEENRLRTLSNENLELKNLYLKAQLDMLYKEAEGLKETNPAIAERIIHIAASIATIIGMTIQK